MVSTGGQVFLIWILMIFPKDYVLSQDKKLEDLHISLTNLKITVLQPGFVRLTWDCNVTDEIQKNTQYIISVNKSPGSKPETIAEKSDKHFEKEMELHKGLSFSVTARIKGLHLFSEAYYIPKGLNGTSAENFSCVAYNVSFMNCSWIMGREAPKDTQYFMMLRQNENVENCLNYRRDSFGRHIACHFPNLSLDFFYTQTYVLVNGSSTTTQIQFFDKWFKIADYERLNPPVNLTLKKDQQNVTMQWKKPETKYRACNSCFEYQICMDDEKSCFTKKGQTSFTIGMNMQKKHTLKIRARLVIAKSKWGEWSTPVEVGDTVPSNKTFGFHIHLILVTVLILIAVLSTFLCKRYQVIQKLFPPVPQPKNKFNDINQYKDKQNHCPITVQSSQKTENEEILVTYIEEMA